MDVLANRTLFVFLLAAIGLIALPHINHLPGPLVIFFFIMLFWRFIGIWYQRWLPGKILLYVFTFTGLALLYQQHLGWLGRDPGTSLFMTALSLKLMEVKRQRDIYLIAYLAFIVAASQFLYEQSIFMAVYIVFVCSVLLTAMVMINSRQSNIKASLKKAMTILMQALPLTLIIFVFFPRVEAPRWLLFEDPNRAMTGLKDSMEPGSISDLGLSDELAFRVKFTGNIPPVASLYWRGPVFSYTDGKRWTQGRHQGAGMTPSVPEFKGDVYRYTLLMEPQDKPWVYALDMPSGFSDELFQNADYQMLTRKAPDKRSEYQLTSSLLYNTRLLQEDEWVRNTQMPGAASPKIIRLIADLQSGTQFTEQFVGNIMRHFREERFSYTLRPPLMENNPVETFLFETRTGFCSHYAAAFVYLMRAANVPARVVTGYQGGTLNEVGGFLEIRQADAHAWAEVWIKDRGWVRYDPTAAVAPERIDQTSYFQQQFGDELAQLVPRRNLQGSFEWLKTTRELWRSLDYSWQRWVINYHSANQLKFLASLGISGLNKMIYWLIAGIAVFTAVLCGYLFRQRQKPKDKALQLYTRFCKKMATTGLVIRAGEGPQDFAGRIKSVSPELAGPVDRITGLFIRYRYGKKPSGQDLSLLKAAISELRIKKGYSAKAKSRSHF
jgi:protein-glutamine gamma-glutamyltransferase